jgi:hypothetical protein
MPLGGKSLGANGRLLDHVMYRLLPAFAKPFTVLPIQVVNDKRRCRSSGANTRFGKLKEIYWSCRFLPMYEWPTIRQQHASFYLGRWETKKNGGPETC